MKNRQNNGQKKKYKMTNNDLQNIHLDLKIESSLPMDEVGYRTDLIQVTVPVSCNTIPQR